MNYEEKAKQLLAVVRASGALGRGSCSTIDECYEDADLLDEYETELFSGSTPVKIVKWAIEMEGIYWERLGLHGWTKEHKSEIAELVKQVRAI